MIVRAWSVAGSIGLTARRGRPSARVLRTSTSGWPANLSSRSSASPAGAVARSTMIRSWRSLGPRANAERSSLMRLGGRWTCGITGHLRGWWQTDNPTLGPAGGNLFISGAGAGSVASTGGLTCNSLLRKGVDGVSTLQRVRSQLSTHGSWPGVAPAVTSLEGASRHFVQPACCANGAAQHACRPTAVVHGGP
jgi:hypothetical protein